MEEEDGIVDGVMVVVVVGMEEEMEEEEVEKLVVEMEGKVVENGGWMAGQRGHHGCGFVLCWKKGGGEK